MDRSSDRPFRITLPSGACDYVKQSTAFEAGFLINMTVALTSALLVTVRLLNEWEGQANSLARLHGYIHIDHEQQLTESGKPPACWSGSGNLVVEHLSAKYSEDGLNVLHGVSFIIKSGERVGLIGRTGSGKSSLTLSLLLCIPTDGRSYTMEFPHPT
ncbi:hypothetical protein C8F04DRAFT_513057 [Mycena alexandri]|uniref:ABC transporter domain-containing protein n=1 Tax=Mycena alexandri TaxID=1745969 RepID=A0AAD6X1P2_9AGAR|nr:hypothetical protein C8F04DRAFT_513057 [Mycena alexandri]